MSESLLKCDKCGHCFCSNPNKGKENDNPAIVLKGDSIGGGSIGHRQCVWLTEKEALERWGGMAPLYQIIGRLI